MEDNREKLLAEAKELGLELPADATEEQIQATIDEKLAEDGEENTTTTPDEGESTSVLDDDVTPAQEEPTEPEPTPEEVEAERKAEEAAAEAKRKEEEEAQAAIEEQKRLEQEAAAPQSEGSQIAAAIREGFQGSQEGKKIRITSDKHVKKMFSIVRSKRTGEMMVRENATGVLSKVQLKSLEEKEADLQSEEVEEL